MSELITEKIEETEQIDSTPEIISEIMPEKRRYRGQRGRDKTPRRVNQNSIMNLKPYRNETIDGECVTIHTSNKMMWIVGIIAFVIIVGVIAWWIVGHKHKTPRYVE